MSVRRKTTNRLTLFRDTTIGAVDGFLFAKSGTTAIQRSENGLLVMDTILSQREGNVPLSESTTTETIALKIVGGLRRKNKRRTEGLQSAGSRREDSCGGRTV